MAVSLGKRKRQSDRANSNTATVLPKRKSASRDRGSSSDEDDDRARTLFQRAFEAKFRPLEHVAGSAKQVTLSREGDEASEEDVIAGDEGSDWDGISDTSEGEIEIVEFSRTTEPSVEEERRRRKGFMSSKPPSSSDDVRRDSAKALAKSGESEPDGSEAVNLKHDLALQRLLKESHLLDPASFHNSSLEPQGKTRLKALDMRIRDLGAKRSVLRQEKMPMSHRKGIIAKAADRETTRRREATQNGIVLEKAKKVGKSTAQKRTRGVGGPTIGKFKGGTLRLSSKDVKSIESSRVDGPGRRKGRR